MARQRKINYGNAEIIEEKSSVSLKKETYGKVEGDSLGFSGAVRVIKFNRRYYMVYGKCFAVAGKNVQYQDALKMKHYSFLDWNNLSNMVAE